MKKRRRDQRERPTQVTPLITLLVLLLANGQTLVLTMRPVCGG